MAILGDLRLGASVRGVWPRAVETVISVQRVGSNAIELPYKEATGKIGNELLYRDREAGLEIVEEGRPQSFDGDGAPFRLVSEGQRIHLANLFDLILAVHISVVESLPHQSAAVCESMLPRQPLRFRPADDPGVGKTIMAGLLIKEAIARGNLQRCLVVCPSSLAEQWQAELFRRFNVPFDIVTNDKLAAARTGNWFDETNLGIARLDKVARNEDAQLKVQARDCGSDLVMVDEAYKLSARFLGAEVGYAERYRIGQLLSQLTRHFLLMTATPHNGKEEDFQLFTALFDGDRFEDRFRDGVHGADVSDLMRRMVKKNRLKFDVTLLFPERVAYTVPYKLSDAEAARDKAVTEYVCQEFDRAEALEDDKRAGSVAFALTIPQRRLAWSPEAIYRSLRRRRERLQCQLREPEVPNLGGQVGVVIDTQTPLLDADDVKDLYNAPDAELEQTDEQVLDQATAARSIEELRIEIEALQRFETLALSIRRSVEDEKSRELASLLGEIFAPASIPNHQEHKIAPYDPGAPVHLKLTPLPHQTLVIFTEHHDTLNHLESAIGTLLGRGRAVVSIHDGMDREERMRAREAFRHDPAVQVLLATDADGECISLPRAHLMVNYDLPWRPNRLEQRFGRIHRIGQTEVCHLWNLVAEETREGDVYRQLLDELAPARDALGGHVFNVLSKVQFEGRSLRELSIDAISYGDQPGVCARPTKAVKNAVDDEAQRDLLNGRALAQDSIDPSRVHHIREDMERTEARRLQPHYVESFFLDVFKRLGGAIRQRELRRYEITHVPVQVRNRDRLIGFGELVISRYESIACEKTLVARQGQPLAAVGCPGHPLLNAVTDISLECYRELLRRGTVLADGCAQDMNPRVLFFVEHPIQGAGVSKSGDRCTVSKRLLFVETDARETAQHLNYAPCLDYRVLGEANPAVDAILGQPEGSWIGWDLENKTQVHAIAEVVPEHLAKVRDRKLVLLDKTEAAVRDRRTREINYWDCRAEQLKEPERRGRANARLNPGEARKWANELRARLPGHMEEIRRERRLSPLPPVVLGGSLVASIGLIRTMGGQAQASAQTVFDTQSAAARAREIVMEVAHGLGFVPTDREFEKLGYNIENAIPSTGRLRFVAVNGRVAESDLVTVTTSEILYSLNKPDECVLAMVAYGADGSHEIRYLRRPFREKGVTIDFAGPAANFPFAQLLAEAIPRRETCMTVKTRKPLIEVALPLDAINAASAREKSIRPGLPSTLHLWWARRPLAAALAVIFAQMVDDPTEHVDVLLREPQTLRAAEREFARRRALCDKLLVQADAGPAPRPEDCTTDFERQRPFRIIGDLVEWQNATNQAVLHEARDEIWQSWRRACADSADDPRAAELFNQYKLPTSLDPFSGSGALALEAQRPGRESYARDLNSVAVLIDKAMIEIPPKFAGQPPVNPLARAELACGSRWNSTGAQGLADDVRYHGAWMRAEALKRIGHLCPKFVITPEIVSERSDWNPYLCQKLTVVAWLGPRSVKSSNSAFANVQVPLASTFMLSNMKGNEAYVEPVIGRDACRFEVKVGKPRDAEVTKNRTELSRGANLRCAVSGSPIAPDDIYADAKAGRMGVRLLASVAAGTRRRIYLESMREHEAATLIAKPEWRPEVAMPENPRWFSPPLYGLTTCGDLFTNRQLVALTTFCDLTREARERVGADALAATRSDDFGSQRDTGLPATVYAQAISIYLGVAVGGLSDRMNTIYTSDASGPTWGTKTRHTFASQAILMSWDFGEVNPRSSQSRSMGNSVDYMTNGLSIAGISRHPSQSGVANQYVNVDKVVSTNALYYDNIGYSGLSDYFFVWLRYLLRSIFPGLFVTLAVPKAEELVATPYWHDGKQKAERFFLDGMTQAMHRLVEQSHLAFPVTIYYASKQSETESADGNPSTRWETFPDAVIRAGFSVSGTWPMRTELSNRMIGSGTNALASSIMQVCRPRCTVANSARRREFVAAMKSELPAALWHLQAGNIASVDLAQGVIGPGMAIQTRYAKVLDAEEKPVPVREALALINATLDDALAELEGDVDADRRWVLTLSEQEWFVEREFGVAGMPSKPNVTSVAGMAKAGILESNRGNERLLKPQELPANWGPTTDPRLTWCQTVHHLIRVLGARSENAQELVYRLYNICERTEPAAEALAYNDLIQSWPRNRPPGSAGGPASVCSGRAAMRDRVAETNKLARTR